MTRKPSYRFVGHTEPWEEKKLSDGISKIGDGIHGTPVYSEDGDCYFINGNNLVDGKIFLFPETKKVQSNQLTVSDTSLKNTILMSINGTIGSLAWYRDEKVMLGKSVAYLTTEEFDRKFIYSILQTPKIVKHFNNNLTGTTIKNLGLKTIRETVISLPSLPEQTAIGSFFQDIDQLISLQQRKLEVLKEQKKTYLKLLFPAKGQTKPALRFAGFENEWKEVKLGDFVEISKGIQRNKEFLSPNADSKNCYPVYNGGKQESGYTDEFNREGNIMISEGGASAGFVNYFDGKYWSGGHNFTIDELENDIYYVLALLESQQQELYSLQVGSGLPNIQLNSLKKVIITFPAFLEQQAIGSFFQDLDKVIAKQEEKVNQLKESKQTLLRKMFI
ncbi:restriction endonuclease subunit S [Streptococcus toyakuensis]|uniref:Type I restriction enzyme specificity protein n=1 Tax=Streptococcus toyakuensis TaxID=2819619 RepID=A0ABM7UPF8_9STRE|nr:restriction endonuclease subunit S [Streptococcus toyakuensis]BDB08294.1 type I restriction enzyme specificity protein [Streptococcus toyakuensis]